MTIELAQKLKEAGFPQHGAIELYIPSLSELIETCGRIDFKLRQTYSAYENKVFYVIEIPGADDMERCNTPEEAVANLWLALQGK